MGNDRTNFRRHESVRSLRLDLGPAVRFFLAVRKNLTAGGKRPSSWRLPVAGAITLKRRREFLMAQAIGVEGE